MDAISFAAFLALASARLPRTEESVVDGGEPDFDLDARATRPALACRGSLPIIISVVKPADAEASLIVDADE